MRVLKVYSKETFVELELSMAQIHLLLCFLDACHVEYSSKEDPIMVEADKYVKNDFFKTLDKLYDQFNEKKF